MIKNFSFLLLCISIVFLYLFTFKYSSIVFAATNFYCLGSCPTSVPGITRPVATPTVQTTSNPETSNVTAQVVNSSQTSLTGDFLQFLQYLFNLLFQLLGVGTTPTPSPTPTPLVPTVTPSLTPTPEPPSVTPTPTIATPDNDAIPLVPNSINIADIKYVPGNEPLKVYNFVAEQVGDQYTFDGVVPGPEIRINEGDHLQVNVLNNLTVPITIHWHGLELPSSQDGVPGINQDSIKPGQTYQYNFVANQAGTYWYHTHQDTVDNLPKGLLVHLLFYLNMKIFLQIMIIRKHIIIFLLPQVAVWSIMILHPDQRSESD